MSEFASLCLLSYNRPKFVMDAILSLQKNSGYPYELIVHDDGSGPETLAVLRQLFADGYISTLIENKEGHNQGQGIALNRMFNMAKGDPIVKMDHDLVFAQGWLKQASLTLQLNEQRPHEPDIGALGLFRYHHPPVVFAESIIAHHEGWTEVDDFVGSAMVIPRRAWEEFGPFEERSPAFAEDYAFKRLIHDREGWCCGMMPHDLAINQGFGPGPSTVVYEKEGGEIGVSKIEDGPPIIRPGGSGP